jgi:hypothetical protein
MRSRHRDVSFLANTSAGQEFGKALGESLFHYPHEKVLDKVYLATCGDKALAGELLASVQEFAKSHVESYTRSLPSGKVSNVHAYENARREAMANTHKAHNQSYAAMYQQNPESHENASRQHEEAIESHKEALKNLPPGADDEKEDHQKLIATHTMAKEFHDKSAKDKRNEADFSHAHRKAGLASEEAHKLKGQSESSIVGHTHAAELHRKAEDLKPGQGHAEKQRQHEALAHANRAGQMAVSSPHFKPKGEENENIRRGAHFSKDAAEATAEAYKTGTPEAHNVAAHAHQKAMEHHLAIHAKHEGNDAEGHHKAIAHNHLKLHIHHLQEAGANDEVSKAISVGAPAMAPVAGQEPAPEATPAPTPEGHDIAQQTGTNAMMVEGRPDEDFGAGVDETAKSHVEGHTRTVNGKVVSVKSYETAKQAADKASKKAESAEKKARGTTPLHSKTAIDMHNAALAHEKAAIAHKNAADAPLTEDESKEVSYYRTLTTGVKTLTPAEHHNAIASEHLATSARLHKGKEELLRFNPDEQRRFDEALANQKKKEPAAPSAPEEKPSRKEELSGKLQEAHQAMSHAHKLHHSLEAFGGVANTPENRRETVQAHHDAANKLEALKGHTHKLATGEHGAEWAGLSEHSLHEKIKEHKDKAHWHEYVASSQEKAREKAKKKGTVAKAMTEGEDYMSFGVWKTLNTLPEHLKGKA